MPLYHILSWTQSTQNILWASSVQSWPVPTHPAVPRDYPNGMGRCSSCLVLPDGGRGQERDWCLAACISNCHNLATDVSAPPNVDCLPSVHVLSICESGAFANPLSAHLWEWWSPA